MRYLFILPLTLHTVFFALFNQTVSPHPDMLDHWVWSRFASLSYYEHPPMIAWFIRAMTEFLGSTEWVLELSSLIYNLCILILAYKICACFFNKKVALIYLLLLQSTLYYFAGIIFLHIDQPFQIFWLLSLFSFCQFCQTKQTRYVIAVGIFAGLGALSKYIMVLFYMGVFLHLIRCQEMRKEFFKIRWYIAGLISLAIFSPVLVWNWQNDWVSFAFQFGRGISNEFGLQNFVAFTLGHLALFSLVWSWQVIRLLFVKKTYTSVESGILSVSIVPLLFFSFASLKGDIADPHWANLFYLGMMMLLASQVHATWQIHSRKIRLLFLGNLFFNLAMIGLIYLHLSQPLIEISQYRLKGIESLISRGMPDILSKKIEFLEGKSLQKQEMIESVQSVFSDEELDQYQDLLLQVARDTKADVANSLLGWEETASQIDFLVNRAGIKQIDYVISREYQLSSALSFYLQDQPFPHSIEKPQRNQWSRKQDVEKSHAVVVCPPRNCDDVLSDIRSLFSQPTRFLGVVKIERGLRIVRVLEVYTWQ